MVRVRGRAGGTAEGTRITSFCWAASASAAVSELHSMYTQARPDRRVGWFSKEARQGWLWTVGWLFLVIVVVVCSLARSSLGFVGTAVDRDSV